jgi:hypothetical protein
MADLAVHRRRLYGRFRGATADEISVIRLPRGARALAL